MNIIPCKKNLDRSITWLDFWLKSLLLQKLHFHIEIESKKLVCISGFISESCSRGGKGPISKFKGGGGHLQLHTFIHTTLVLVNW